MHLYIEYTLQGKILSQSPHSINKPEYSPLIVKLSTFLQKVYTVS